jgi:predicted amino acid dehydrogenase
LRIAPSAYISASELDAFAGALEQLCRVLAAGDLQHFFGPGGTAYANAPVIDRLANARSRRAPAQVERRVAFVGHLIEPADLRKFDPCLAGLTDAQLEQFVNATAEAVGPTIYEQHHVRSITGERVHLSFIGLNLYSKQIAQAWRKRKSGWMRDNIHRAVEIARDSGCSVAGLGGYTSIVTHNCESAALPGIALTSGNALTVGMGILALKEAAAQQGIGLRDARLAIVGATGNIASIYAAMLAREVPELVLVVRDVTAPKVSAVCTQIRAVAADVKISVVDDPDALRECNLIVTASNAAQPLIHPRHLSSRPTAICDISVPTDVAPSVHTERPNVLVIQGGNVRLPHDPEFQILGLPLEKGHVFACMAETLLMGLEGPALRGSLGALSFKDVETALACAAKHGFVLGDFRKFHTI